MSEQEFSYNIHIRTGFFRLDPYEMILSNHGIHLYQMHENRSVERIYLPNLEIQKVIIYQETQPELEIVTPRDVFSGVLSKKTDIARLYSDLISHFGVRAAIY
jgi:hypothetical protein